MGTGYLAEHDTHEAATHARPSATAEPDSVLGGRNADQVVESRTQELRVMLHPHAERWDGASA